MYKILLIDDDVALTDLLCEYLSQQHYELEVANSPLEGLQKLREGEFHLVLLDVMMPEMDGFETLRQLRQFSSVAVIMLTAKGDDYDKILGLELGADDYLPKPFNHRELLARIKALLRRLDTLSASFEGQGKGETIKLHGIEMNESSHSVRVNDADLAVTATEFLMLLHLIKHPGQLISKEQLSSVILGRKLAPFDRSLDVHVSNIRKKLAQHGIDDVIKTVRGNGYMMTAS
jgi:two-component system response regulator CpxR